MRFHKFSDSKPWESGGSTWISDTEPCSCFYIQLQLDLMAAVPRTSDQQECICRQQRTPATTQLAMKKQDHPMPEAPDPMDYPSENSNRKSSTEKSLSLLRLREALELTKLSRSAFYALVKEELMPKPIKMSTKANRRSAARWIESEVVDAIQQLANRR
jgi:predicted DNA-binding transcriptional regulator AlpA